MVSPPHSLWLLVSGLLLCSSRACRVGTPEECQDAPFVPGHNLAGEGFDVVSLQHKGSYVIDLQTYLTHTNSCTVCENPHMDNQLQKLPLSVLDWRATSSCRQELSSALLTSVSSVAQTASSLIENDWSVGLEVEDLAGATVAGGHSTEVEFASASTKVDKSLFASHQLSCTHYSYRVPSNPPLSAEFLQHIHTLPQEYSLDIDYVFRRFIDLYGTHYIRQVRLGGRLSRLTSIRSCLATINGHSASEVKDCINTGLSVGLGFVDASITTGKCKTLIQNEDSETSSGLAYLNHVTEVLGGHRWLGEVSLIRNDSTEFRGWLNSLKETPDIISYSLFPLHELMPSAKLAQSMQAAMRQYLKDSSLPSEGPPSQCTGRPNLSHECCPISPMRGHLQVTIIKAWDLDGDPVGPTDPYAKLFYWKHFQQTHWIKSEDNPHWNSRYDLGHVEAQHQLRVEVWDKDVTNDDHLGTCYTTLHPGTHTVNCGLSHGGLSFSYTLTCDPHLMGHQCSRYNPST